MNGNGGEVGIFSRIYTLIHTLQLPANMLTILEYQIQHEHTHRGTQFKVQKMFFCVHFPDITKCIHRTRKLHAFCRDKRLQTWKLYALNVRRTHTHNFIWFITTLCIMYFSRCSAHEHIVEYIWMGIYIHFANYSMYLSEKRSQDWVVVRLMLLHHTVFVQNILFIHSLRYER